MAVEDGCLCMQDNATSLECKETIHLTPGRRGISNDMHLKVAFKQLNDSLLDAHVRLHNERLHQSISCDLHKA